MTEPALDDLLIGNSTLLRDETPVSVSREGHLPEVSASGPASPPGKIEGPSKPTPPNVVWRTLMLEQ